MASYERDPAALNGAGSMEPGSALQTTEVPTVHRVVTHLARRLNQVCLGISAEATMPDGLTPQEYAVLVSADEAPGLDQRSLAERLAIDAMTVTQYVDKLQAMGLVTRSAHASDRRVRLLNITASGRQLRRRIKPHMQAAHNRILAPLTNDERTQLVEIMTRIVEANESYAKPGAGRRRPVRARQPEAIVDKRGK